MRTLVRNLVPFVITITLVACGGDGKFQQVQIQPPVPPVVTVDAGIKRLIFNWPDILGATHYKLFENPDGHSGFTQVGENIAAGTLSVTMPIAVHLHDFANALYIVQACNTAGCTGSSEVNAMNLMLNSIGYFKASNTAGMEPDDPEGWRHGDTFGAAVALSTDSRTLAVGAWREDSSATGINGNEDDNSAFSSGAVYLFRFDGTNWSQQAYVKASNTGGGDLSDVFYIFEGDVFGAEVALSADGNTLAVGAPYEDSAATSVNGDQDDNSAKNAGAVYVFRFDGAAWSQQAYIKASNTDTGTDEWGLFGSEIALSADGNTMAVGNSSEDSNSTGINGDQNDNSASNSGAVYLFRFDGLQWSQQAYIKASNTDEGDGFGVSVSLGADGNILAVGANGEDSNATGINGDQVDNTRLSSGAAYIFQFDGTNWSQNAYVKATNTDEFDSFGGSVVLSGNGNTLAIGASHEASGASGVNGDQDDNSAHHSGAVYVLHYDGNDWLQQAYIKASNVEADDYFGGAIALSTDGETLAVGAIYEDSSAIGINGSQTDNSAPRSGAAYIFRFDGADWSPRAYVKAPNTDAGDYFAWVSLNGDGETLAVGAIYEDSSAVDINGDRSDNSAEDSGAIYLY